MQRLLPRLYVHGVQATTQQKEEQTKEGSKNMYVYIWGVN